ncbi:hypothetical protein Thiosp_03552 [Thiorhodovibrio litoralis]|uniref:hypothetical protein n=1 Tax=Thiorhodovibrio winogradskyi TaxID=77007 RepID=UPI001911887A|nr:hypothetical protein [Thiorhodovibrio winogradskyi]WPL13735.1 hypothetical protein Thiosp_03552 [Thiorhodovibrio litoralis]
MHHHRPLRQSWSLLCSLAVVATGLVFVLTTPAAKGTEPSVYRCTATDGSIEFRQFPCHGRDDSLLLEIDDRPSGWTPPDPADVFKDEPERKPRSSSAESSSDARKDAAADRRWEEKCLKKQHQIEQVNRKLRAGYTASEGQRLRHKRAEYEDYVKKFCD